MNKLNDKDLREALRRHEAKRLKPQVSEDFCDNVMQALTETDTVSTEQPKRRRMWLYPAIGIAAAIALLFSLNIALSYQDGEEPSLVAQTDTTRVIPQTETKKAEEHPLEEKGNKEMADTVKKVKEMIQMTKTPRHYMAKRDKQVEPIAEPEVIDATDIAEQAIAEEERRIAMQMMQRMNGSLQDDYLKMTREIRERGNSMTQQATIAMNNEE